VSEYSAEQIAAWRESDRKHHFHAMTNPLQHERGAKSILLTHAKGVYLYDSDGNRYLDAVSGLGCVNIGYGNEAVADASCEAMKQLSFMHTYFGATNRWACELSEKMAQITPTGFEHFYYAGSGSEATESAVKIAWHYWQLRNKPSKKMVISRTHAFHGNTIFACSLTGIQHYHPQFGLPIQSPLIGRVNAPYWWRDGGDMTPEDYGKKVALELEDYIEQVGADSIAAFIAEPVLGAGGMVIPPPGYWPEINRICRQHDVLLILDEVVTGFGKTGRWFGCETFGIDADLLALAKGMSSNYVPQSAVAIGSRVAEVLTKDDALFVHGFTNNAHPVTAATALANIKVIEEQGLVEKVANCLGPYFGEKLQALGEHSTVGEVRHCGVLGALEFSPDKTRRHQFPADAGIGDQVAALARDRGLIVRPLNNIISFALPMITSNEEVDELFDILSAAIESVAAHTGIRDR
jgi:putrescine aminotransferase